MDPGRKCFMHPLEAPGSQSNLGSGSGLGTRALVLEDIMEPCAGTEVAHLRG